MPLKRKLQLSIVKRFRLSLPIYKLFDFLPSLTSAFARFRSYDTMFNWKAYSSLSSRHRFLSEPWASPHSKSYKSDSRTEVKKRSIRFQKWKSSPCKSPNLWVFMLPSDLCLGSASYFLSSAELSALLSISRICGAFTSFEFQSLLFRVLWIRIVTYLWLLVWTKQSRKSLLELAPRKESKESRKGPIERKVRFNDLESCSLGGTFSPGAVGAEGVLE